MKVSEAQRIIAKLAEACAYALEDGKDELPSDTFSAPAHQALDDLNVAIHEVK